MADALSRIDEVHSEFGTVDFAKIARAQVDDTKLDLLRADPKFSFKRLTMSGSNSELYCEISSGAIRPYVPMAFREIVFKAVQGVVSSWHSRFETVVEVQIFLARYE